MSPELETETLQAQDTVAVALSPRLLKDDTLDRRQFMTQIGTLVFGATVIDLTGALAYADSNDCSSQPPDATCGTDPSGHSEIDEACSTDDIDQNCHTLAPGLGQGDEDQSCGSGMPNDADEGCGDCNDAHDDDNNCGDNGGDPDEMCGHAHIPWTGDEDDNCQGSTDADEGCGVHNGPGTLEWEDPDQSCNEPTSPDRSCAGDEYDANCDPGGTNTSTPDEHCGVHDGVHDEDAACEQWFDTDDGCGTAQHNDQDQSCGSLDTSNPYNTTTANDENCGYTGFNQVYDSDQQCGLDGNGDEGCGNPNDPDDAAS